jgi:hypothetical protein
MGAGYIEYHELLFSRAPTSCPESLGCHSLCDKPHWTCWASALILIEPRLRRTKGYCHLPQLRAALQAKIGKAERVEGTRIA